MHPWLVLNKPHTLPFYSSMQLQYGLFTSTESMDCVASRLVQQFEPLRDKVRRAEETSVAALDAASSSNSDASAPPVTFPLTSQDWFSRGATLAATNPETDAFLGQCESVGAVLRKYHVLCRVPQCVTSRETLEAAAAAATTAMPQLTNPSLLKLVQRKHVQRAMLASGVDGVPADASNPGTFAVPSCVTRFAEVRGSLLEGRIISPAGTLFGAFSTFGQMASSDQLSRSRRLADLFTPKRTACGAACSCEAQREAFSTKYRALTPSVVVPVPIATAKFRPVTLDYALLRFDPTKQLALFEVSTATASEAHIRCMFAASGFPVLHDPDFDIAFALALSRIANDAHATVAAPFQIEAKRAARREDRALKQLGSAQGEFVGLGLFCRQVTFPDPSALSNRSMLMHLSAAHAEHAIKTKRVPLHTMIKAFECVNVSLAAPTSLAAAFDDPEATATNAVVTVKGLDRIAADENESESDALVVVSTTDAQGRDAASRSLLPGSSPVQIAARVQPSVDGSSAKPRRCRFCFGPHPLSQCPQVNAYSHRDGDRAFCIRCGQRGHDVSTCELGRFARVTKRCMVCDMYDPDHPAASCPRAVKAPLPSTPATATPSTASSSAQSKASSAQRRTLHGSDRSSKLDPTAFSPTARAKLQHLQQRELATGAAPHRQRFANRNGGEASTPMRSAPLQRRQDADKDLFRSIPNPTSKDDSEW